MEMQANLYVLGEHLKRGDRERETSLKQCTDAFRTGPKVSFFPLQYNKLTTMLLKPQLDSPILHFSRAHYPELHRPCDCPEKKKGEKLRKFRQRVLRNGSSVTQRDVCQLCGTW